MSVILVGWVFLVIFLLGAVHIAHTAKEDDDEAVTVALNREEQARRELAKIATELWEKNQPVPLPEVEDESER